MQKHTNNLQATVYRTKKINVKEQMCTLFYYMLITLSFVVDAKVIHIMKGINNIFRPKGKSSSKLMKVDEIFHIIEVTIGIR